MNLKPQPRPRASATGRPKRSGARRVSARPRGGGRQARRPGVPLRRRLGPRIPSLRRLLAVLALYAVTGGMAALLHGPWLRVSDVAWSGEHYTDDTAIAAILDDERGTSLLAVNTNAVEGALAALPSVETAKVEATLAGGVVATISEPAVAFLWESATTRYLGAADGTIFAAEPRDAELTAGLETVPRILDERFVARRIAVGDVIPERLLAAALDILEIEAAELGSTAGTIGVRLDDEFGFRLVSSAPGWEVALGMYGIDPNESATDATARLERQVTAVRTLFAQRPESNIGWVDVRNPGKVYFRAKG